jgi:hypothetical protein
MHRDDTKEAGQGHGYQEHYNLYKPQQSGPREGPRDSVVLGLSRLDDSHLLRCPAAALLHLRYFRLCRGIQLELGQHSLGCHVAADYDMCGSVLCR